jgi:hypothetical protein
MPAKAKVSGQGADVEAKSKKGANTMVQSSSEEESSEEEAPKVTTSPQRIQCALAMYDQM